MTKAKAKAKEAEVETQTAATEAGPEATVEPVQLTLADLRGIANVIDLASRRGAFQANELTAVGNAYNKLSSFLAYVESTQAPAEETAETPAE